MLRCLSSRRVCFAYALGMFVLFFFVFFFSSRRRHTRLQGDWSSDVCSSDLHHAHEPERQLPRTDGGSHRRCDPRHAVRRLRGTLRSTIIAAALLAAACGRDASPERDASPGSFPGAPVILISVDALRADRLPAYGYRGVETPNIDGLRGDSVLFERVYSHCPMTLPSHASMFTGSLPTEHGVRNSTGYRFEGAKL